MSKAAEAGLEKKHEAIEELESQVQDLKKMLKRREKDVDIELRPDFDEEDKEVGFCFCALSNALID